MKRTLFLASVLSLSAFSASAAVSTANRTALFDDEFTNGVTIVSDGTAATLENPTWNTIQYYDWGQNSAWRQYQSNDTTEATNTNNGVTDGSKELISENNDGTITLWGRCGNYTNVKNSTSSSSPVTSGTYACGGIFTNQTFSFQYGYVEVRAKFDSVQGVWPAIWMMPVDGTSWPKNGEIDLMEHLNDQSKVYQTLHFYNDEQTGDQSPSPGVNNSSGAAISGTNDWHTYGVEWTAKAITFYIDGEATGTITSDSYSTWPFGNENNEFYLMIDQQIGGSWVEGASTSMNGTGGIDTATLTSTGAAFAIDYVRVYSAESTDSNTYAGTDGIWKVGTQLSDGRSWQDGANMGFSNEQGTVTVDAQGAASLAASYINLTNGTAMNLEGDALAAADSAGITITGADGTSLAIANDISLGSGPLNINGGAISISGAVSGSASALNVNSGSLALTGKRSVGSAESNVSIASGASLSVTGSGRLFADTYNSDSVLALSGHLTVDGIGYGSSLGQLSSNSSNLQLSAGGHITILGSNDTGNTNQQSRGMELMGWGGTNVIELAEGKTYSWLKGDGHDLTREHEKEGRNLEYRINSGATLTTDMTLTAGEKLTKTGAGTLKYTGTGVTMNDISVKAGTLELTGAVTGAMYDLTAGGTVKATVNVAEGATLAMDEGSSLSIYGGAVNGSVSGAGKLSVLAGSNLTLAESSEVSVSTIELRGSTLTVNGALGSSTGITTTADGNTISLGEKGVITSSQLSSVANAVTISGSGSLATTGSLNENVTVGTGWTGSLLKLYAGASGAIDLTATTTLNGTTSTGTLLQGASGWLATSATTITTKLVLENAGTSAALNWTACSSQTWTFNNTVSGSGDIKLTGSTSTGTPTLVFAKDVSGWTGSFSNNNGGATTVKFTEDATAINATLANSATLNLVTEGDKAKTFNKAVSVTSASFSGGDVTTVGKLTADTVTMTAPTSGSSSDILTIKGGADVTTMNLNSNSWTNACRVRIESADQVNIGTLNNSSGEGILSVKSGGTLSVTTFDAKSGSFSFNTESGQGGGTIAIADKVSAYSLAVGNGTTRFAGGLSTSAAVKTTAESAVVELGADSTLASVTGSGTISATGGTTTISGTSDFSGALKAAGGNINVLNQATALSLAELTLSGGTVGVYSGSTVGAASEAAVTVNKLTVTAGSTLNANLTVAAGAAVSIAAGGLSMGSTLTLNSGATLANYTDIASSLALGDSYTLFTGVDALTLAGSRITGDISTSNKLLANSIFGNVSNDYYLTYDAASADGGTLSLYMATPEPATATLALLALAGVCSRRRRR